MQGGKNTKSNIIFLPYFLITREARVWLAEAEDRGFDYWRAKRVWLGEAEGRGFDNGSAKRVWLDKAKGQGFDYREAPGLWLPWVGHPEILNQDFNRQYREYPQKNSLRRHFNSPTVIALTQNLD